jgi:hypothetical protein
LKSEEYWKMPTLLERYNQGDHEGVWAEMVALRESIRQEPVYSDACAVAKETMRRARHNVELIAERLHGLGFVLVYPQAVLIPPSPAAIAEMDAFEKQIGLIPLSLRAWVEEVGSVNFMGTYPGLSYYAPSMSPFMASTIQTGRVDAEDLLKEVQNWGMPPEMRAMLGGDMIRQVADQLNKMLPGMFHNIGEENLGHLRDHAQQAKEQSEQHAAMQAPEMLTDPLVVEPDELSLDWYEEWQTMVEEQELDNPFSLTIAPDIFHKSNISGGGGYEIVLPNPAADAPLLYTDWGNLTFVQYLRLSFQWGGFPGLREYDQRDESALSKLKEGLLPI